MKNTLLCFTITLCTHVFCLEANAQVFVDTPSCFYDIPWVKNVYTFCDTLFIDSLDFRIEPSVNNIWQVGKTGKFGNTDPKDTDCLLITDTLDPYPSNNISAFQITLPIHHFASNFGWSGYEQYYFSFWHKYDLDSNSEGAWIEFSLDSGNTWIRDLNQLPFIHQFCYPNNYNSLLSSPDSNYNNMDCWSGPSNGWKYVQMNFNVFWPVEPNRSNLVNALRFVFYSDGIQTNKPGWAINDFRIGWMEIISGIHENLLHHGITFYPNPNSGTIRMKSKDEDAKKIVLINSIGQTLLSEILYPEQTLDLSRFQKGIYFIKVWKEDQYLGLQKIVHL